ncbi:hypothetical protein EV190_102100 [Actinorugispora endophytica]|uniref:Uncharacterized protein n=1 Tax=Actinorugispora endophytica TaxID=1605990 RepID=A0A4R6V6X9_9ACTN|nr:hypothetical protein EV190_102100 [Actinorugispora endophytica]
MLWKPRYVGKHRKRPPAGRSKDLVELVRFGNRGAHLVVDLANAYGHGNGEGPGFWDLLEIVSRWGAILLGL